MNHRKTEEKVNAIVNEVLDEAQRDDVGATRSQDCPDDCGGTPQNTPEETSWRCKCGIENSPRFSLRVMEAMRSLQRDVDRPPTSSAEDIVDYIRANYRSDGDLYAQVRTALRQVCSQGFVLELLRNEYHLVGPVVRAKRKYGCSLDCEGRAAEPTTDDISRRQIRDNDRVPPRRDLRATFEEPIDERDDDADRDDADRDDAEEEFVSRYDRDEAELGIPGPSREFAPSPIRNAKRPRLEDQRVQRADDDEEENATEADCVVCNAEEEYPAPERPRGRPRGNRRRRRPRENGDDEENGEEDEEENGEEDDEEERREENDDDEDTDDSLYRELRARGARGRARERELRKWIRRCREECERRGRR